MTQSVTLHNVDPDLLEKQRKELARVVRRARTLLTSEKEALMDLLLLLTDWSDRHFQAQEHKTEPDDQLLYRTLLVRVLEDDEDTVITFDQPLTWEAARQRWCDHMIDNHPEDITDESLLLNGHLFSSTPITYQDLY